MNAPRRIGILGGMGPEATVLLMQRLIAGVPARDDADHIPLYVDMNPQVPSRIARLIEGRGRDPGPVLAEMARGLEESGAEALAMPCNTAHHYAPQIAAAVSIPLLNMVELSADAALRAAGRGAGVGIIASPAVRLTGVFEPALKARGLRPVYPEEAAEAALFDAIRAIKRDGVGASERATLRRAVEVLTEADAAVALVACTELSLAADALGPDAPAIDTLDVLARAVICFATNGSESGAPREVPRTEGESGTPRSQKVEQA